MERKRKRTRVRSQTLEHRHRRTLLPREAINPFSRSSNERQQLLVAGLNDADEDPTLGLKNFPHQGFRGKLYQDEILSDDEEAYSHAWQPVDDTSDESRARAATQQLVQNPSREHKLDMMIRSIHQLLDQGGVERAARLFGLVLQLRPGSRPIDIRQHNLWAVGAEIILREGEESRAKARNTTNENSPFTQCSKGVQIFDIWRTKANMPKLRTYLSCLSQNHPYDHKFPHNVSALDFKIALLGWEIFCCHVDFTSAMERFNEDLDDWQQERSFESTDDDSMASNTEGHGPLGKRVRQTSPFQKVAKEDIRLRTYRVMNAMVKEMDSIIQEMPYSRSTHFLQLRAVVSLLIADLLVGDDVQEGQHLRTRQLEQEAASQFIRKINRSERDFFGIWISSVTSHLNTRRGQQTQHILHSLPIRSTT
ncbi:hypothetical protein AAL_06937 [Moelleriella libera RCEF 2490]|uniref:Uncharacterized protein n=1 Tax=Moelleriella libera RCEF 2490 TaxID=1081109 RepID=A0A167YDC7_9HYPO|nr:hypothetical protein AAL_06937 [Moelleriella libera RCEF 2490]